MTLVPDYAPARRRPRVIALILGACLIVLSFPMLFGALMLFRADPPPYSLWDWVGAAFFYGSFLTALAGFVLVVIGLVRYFRRPLR